MKLTKRKIDSFQKIIWDFYKKEGRSFAWRNVLDPYKIVVSELMLQQTQTSRVIEKFEKWIEHFPSFASLAEASLFHVLRIWQGLGYNRRGKYLHEIAKRMVEQYNGVVPNDPEVLITFPGIGKYTASSICAFAFNSPTVCVETNIRTVFIHFFFQNIAIIHDRDIEIFVAQTVDETNPREWYYALMDYGVMLKKKGQVSNVRSAHYIKQNRFEGSDRQIRGKIIQILTKVKKVELPELVSEFEGDPQRIMQMVDDLTKEGLIICRGELVFI